MLFKPLFTETVENFCNLRKVLKLNFYYNSRDRCAYMRKPSTRHEKTPLLIFFSLKLPAFTARIDARNICRSIVREAYSSNTCPITVSKLFKIARPDSRCEEVSDCYLQDKTEKNCGMSCVRRLCPQHEQQLKTELSYQQKIKIMLKLLCLF